MLIRVTSLETVWPYSVPRLRADHPNTSFGLNPTAEDLAPFGVYIVSETLPPSHDPALYLAVEKHPVNVDGQWMQSWELQDVPPAPPAPNWQMFKTVMLGDEHAKAALLAAMAHTPFAVMAIGTTALEKAIAGDLGEFQVCWQQIRSVEAIDQSKLDGVADVARAAHLPETFVDIVSWSAEGGENTAAV